MAEELTAPGDELVAAEDRDGAAADDYRAIFEATGDGVIIADMDGNLVDVNPALCRMHGYSRQEMWSLAQSLHLNRDAVSITLESWQRPRLDISPDGYFVTATLPRIDAEARRVFAGEVDLFVGRNLLVSAHKQPPVLSKRIRARARLAPDDLRADPSFLVYIILDELIAYYERLGEHVDDEVEKLEERALTDTSDI